ncbi:MAG: hypothetical protein ACPGXK_04270 [Phycisphaerae bacterium]
MSIRIQQIGICHALILALATNAWGGSQNDTCFSALAVSDGVPAAVGNNMTAGAVDEQNSCTVSGNDVWYLYTATCDGTVTIDTFGSSQPDTTLSAYTSCGSVELACNDDTNSLLSEIAFSVVQGESYPVRVASVGPAGGYVLNISCAAAPVNDGCFTASVVVEGVPAFEGDNANALSFDDAEVSCALIGDSNDVWFQYEASCDGVAVINTTGSGQSDPLLSVFSDCGGNGDEIACNDDAIGAQAEVTIATTVAEVYYIRLASADEPGDYDLNIQCIQGPANDSCDEALLVVEGTPAAEGDNTAAGADQIEASCVPSDFDLWYEYEAGCTGLATIDLQGSLQVDPVFSVFDACGGNETVCNDDAAGLPAEAMFDVVAGSSYWVRVASLGAPGDFDLNISCAGFPSNDACVDATIVTDGQPAVQGSNSGASTSSGPASSCQTSVSDVWFSYTTSCSGILTIDTFGSGQDDTVLDVFPDCGSGAVVCSDDTNNALSQVSFGVADGEAYLIRLASVADPGDFDLNISCLDVPTNDTCSLAANVMSGTAAASGNNTLASATDQVEASCAASDYDVWFSYEPSCSSETTVSTTGSGQASTVISLYGSCGGNELACDADLDGEGAAITFQAEEGSAYLIRLASAADPGDFTLNIDFLDANGNGIPDTCEVQAPQVLPLGSRYLQVSPAAGEVPVALRVVSADLPCLIKYVDLEVNPVLVESGIGRLVDAPVYRTPSEWGELLVRDEAIAPAYRYVVQAETNGGGAVAASGEVTTNILGDVDGNGAANISDVQLAILAFQNNFPGSLAQVDLSPCKPDAIVNLGDALWAAIGFQGGTFEELCTLPCAD